MDGKFQYDESLAITNKEQSLYYFTIGGDPAVGVQGSLNPENSPSIDIGKWMASVNLPHRNLLMSTIIHNHLSPFMN